MLTGEMKILFRGGSSHITGYNWYTMAQTIQDIHDTDSPVVGYELQGRDY